MQANRKTLRLCVTAVLMACNVALCAFSIPVPGGHFYLNDVVICTSALLLDPISAFLIGGVGAFLGDLLFYPLPMFVSLASHGLQAAAISWIAHNTFKKHPLLADCAAVSIGAIIMVVGYTLGRAYIYATPQYAIVKLPFEILQAVVGAAAGVALCRNPRLNAALKKTGL